MARAIVESYRPLADRARCTLKLELPDEEIVIAGDRLAFEQILDNLISNGINYGAGTPIVVSAQAHATTVLLSVSDKGPGIAPETQARIFERFERAARPGANTRRCVSSHATIMIEAHCLRA